MKKPINTETLVNELQDTPFFRRSQPASPPALQETPQATTEASPALPNARPVERSNGRPSERPNDPSPVAKPKRRQARRYSFEIFEDQIERIKRIALQDQLRGGELNQSTIARNALDRYLPELEAELKEGD